MMIWLDDHPCPGDSLAMILGENDFRSDAVMARMLLTQSLELRKFSGEV